MEASGLGDDDVVEQDGGELPGWTRMPGWLHIPGRLRAPGWRSPRGAAILGAAGLLIGLIAGYAAGYRQAGGGARHPATVASAQASASALASALASASAASGSGAYSSSLGVTGLAAMALTQSGEECSQQHGRELQVGVEVTNQSTVPVIPGQVRPVLPLGGLQVVAVQWAPCGVISPAGQSVPAAVATPQKGSGVVRFVALAGGTAIPPGGSAWLSATFRVLEHCPGPLPVLFTVSYEANRHVAVAQLPGFPDLGQVPYSGCPAG